MAVVKGPFKIKWGESEIDSIESIDINFEKKVDDYVSNAGKVFEVDRAERIVIAITLLATDIPALSLLLPQYFIQNGELMSTGQTVDSPDGALEFLMKECTGQLVYNNLEIIPCDSSDILGVTPQILRVIDTWTQVDGVFVDNRVRKVVIRFVGESRYNTTFFQIMANVPFGENILLLENGEIFLLEDGDTLAIQYE